MANDIREWMRPKFSLHNVLQLRKNTGKKLQTEDRTTMKVQATKRKVAKFNGDLNEETRDKMQYSPMQVHEPPLRCDVGIPQMRRFIAAHHRLTHGEIPKTEKRN